MSNRVTYIFDAKNLFSNVSKKINGSIKNVRTNFRGLSKEIKESSFKSGRATSFLSDNFKKLAAIAAGYFGVKQFLGIGSRFQDSLLDLSAITGAVGKDFDNLKQKIADMAIESITSQEEVATAIKLVASAKPELLTNIDLLTKTTDQVLLLKNAAGIQLSEAALITSESLNQFGADASQASKFVNILAAGAKLGSSEIANTGAASVIAGPGARAAGLSFLQLNAAIQTVARGGIKGARSGTALGVIFGRLRRLGVDFEKMGLQGAFEAVKKALERTTDKTKRAQLEAKIFGEEHSKVGLAVLDNVEFLGHFERVLKDTNIAQEQADIRLGGLSKRLLRLGIIVSDKLIKVFDRVEPLLTKQANAFGDWFASINEGDIKSFAESVTVLAGVFGILLDILKAVLSVVKLIGQSISDFIGLISKKGVFSGILSSFAAIADLPKNIGEGLSIGGKLFGLFGGETVTPPAAPELSSNFSSSSSKTDVNVNLKAQEGMVESVKTRTTGNVPGMNVGFNMVNAL